MVGEIRDKEVASTAVNAALTGHLVFSTLHTNNAAGTFPRLIDLGVNPKVIGSAINVVMAQRLVRKLKDDYKKEIKLEGKDKEIVNRILDSIYDKKLIPKNTSTIFEATEDSPNAYSGRVGLFEAIIMNEEIEKLIAENPSERDINRAAKKQGILTMAQDGILKALQGATSLSELKRVIDLEEINDSLDSEG
jgi:type II secretory ATPase GspE/PulE/Tfp pilus assembly ATPase PilB-like protein